MLSVPETICNTSPLIALDNIGLLALLEGVYGHILVAEEGRDSLDHNPSHFESTSVSAWR
jgi:predicted nucleic acid-binding protein